MVGHPDRGTVPVGKATAVWAVVHEDGLHSIFEEATPTFKARFMAMAGYVDEVAFDAFARRWTISDDARRDHGALPRDRGRGR